MDFDVVGLGTVLVDHLVVLPEHPGLDTKTTVSEDRFQVGGPVPTALVLLRRFGRRCAMIGAWGDDAFGALIDADLARERIDTARCLRRPGERTSFAHVWIDSATGARTVACGRPTRRIEPRDLDARMLRRTRALHLDGWSADAAIAAAGIVRAAGGRVFLDTGSLKPGMDELIRRVDVLNCPRRFLVERFGTDDVDPGAAQLLAMGPTVVTVTDGTAGAWLATEDCLLHEPARPVRAVDTTGAGDVFCGMLIHAALAGRPVDRWLGPAASAAAHKCTALGNRAALPRRDGIEDETDAAAPALA